ncbi:MAG: family 78 glycoside hydrolase catalytic domain [Paludibacter sp.]|nr:family 78 glycoside hydrolase catalytic domain [Paludibacter sp.]
MWLNFKKNLTGWLQADFSGLENGQKLKFYYVDRIFTDSIQLLPISSVNVYPWSGISLPRKDGKRNLYQYFNQISEYVARGGAKETFCNKFNYAGFRYVII